ncbi:MAG: kinase [Rickettsiaceae bacterium]|nr:MAG: kinase [Rickettsiaceae bacterium]
MFENFKSNIINIHGQDGEKFLSLLPEKIEYISKLWQLKSLKPLENISHNYILSGYHGNLSVILKVGFRATDIKQEAEALKLFGNYEAVKVLACQDEYLLLERIMPGYSLKTYLPSQHQEALKIVSKIVSKIYIPLNKPSSSVSFLHIKTQLEILDTTLHKYKLNCQQLFDLKFLFYLHEAIILKNELINTSTEMLIHGDLHHDNILWNGKNWQIIDPKGIIGYQCNEFWAFIINIENDTKFVANFFNIDLQLIRQWYFVDLMLRTCQNLKDNTTPTLFFDLAKKVFNLL